MLDINLIRENPDAVRKALAKRLLNVEFRELLEWDSRRRSLISEADELKARKNRVSSQIPEMKKKGEDVQSLIEEMKGFSEGIKDLDDTRNELDARIKAFIDGLPNLPAEDVPAGGKENNQVIRTSGQPRELDFPLKDHMELVGLLGLVDYRRGAKLAGNGFWIYRGRGALMEWGLLNYFAEQHLRDGYEFILPPHILNYQCGYTAGQFPKFMDEVYLLSQDSGEAPAQFLLPTSETALASLHQDEIVPEESLPLRYFSFTPCYRKEAGSYRTGERGMIRGHQFNKMEIFQYTLPEASAEAQEELLVKAENLVKGLGLHYRISKLAAADCGAAMAKTYDVEVWLPSIGEYKEVSSVSNANDYQARRGNIRFKRKDTGKNEFLHTLNASGLATSRLLPAICEQFQEADGSVGVPEVLQKWLGCSRLEPDVKPGAKRSSAKTGSQPKSS